ncbi:hypothetical protein NPIL_296001 [Nephila pilipes]|uniref:Uncharacterized protein n=1 Tax=Nephila pilipes TaxID=299642 RepID=A0A8X6PEP9_NEPPI|nr:hypothetical protein NPIL_296001 [Nephila pilipes]
MERGDDAIIISPENNDQISIPALQKDIPELALMKIKRQDFIKAQKDHDDLKTIYEQVLSQTTALNKSYSLVDELLVKNREDKLGNIVNPQCSVSQSLDARHDKLRHLCMNPEYAQEEREAEFANEMEKIFDSVSWWEYRNMTVEGLKHIVSVLPLRRGE